MFKYYDPLNSNSNCAEHWWTNINFIHNLFENPHRNQSSEIPNIQIKSCKNVCKLFNKTKIWRKLPLRKSCLEYYSYLFNTILIYLLLFVPLGIIYISLVYLKQTTLNGCPYINSIYIHDTVLQFPLKGKWIRELQQSCIWDESFKLGTHPGIHDHWISPQIY